MDSPRDSIGSSSSRVAEDYLKAIWSSTEGGGEPATTSSLAKRFSTSKATVSINVKRLVAQGLLEHVPYGEITLTESGRKLAISMVRAHRVLETFLVDSLGYGWDEIHEIAERMEHAATDEFIARLHALLGHPAQDPHGDPIPTRQGGIDYPQDAHILGLDHQGTYEVVRISDADSERLREFAHVGIVPGARIELTSETAHDARIAVLENGSRIPLSAEQLDLLIVRIV